MADKQRKKLGGALQIRLRVYGGTGGGIGEINLKKKVGGKRIKWFK